MVLLAIDSLVAFEPFAGLVLIVRLENPVQRMHLDHVHVRQSGGKSAVGNSVAVFVEKDLSQVRMILLHEFFAAIVPQREPGDLHFGIVVVRRPAAILRPRLVNQREGIVMI